MSELASRELSPELRGKTEVDSENTMSTTDTNHCIESPLGDIDLSKCTTVSVEDLLKSHAEEKRKNSPRHESMASSSGESWGTTNTSPAMPTPSTTTHKTTPPTNSPLSDPASLKPGSAPPNHYSPFECPALPWNTQFPIEITTQQQYPPPFHLHGGILYATFPPPTPTGGELLPLLQQAAPGHQHFSEPPIQPPAFSQLPPPFQGQWQQAGCGFPQPWQPQQQQQQQQEPLFYPPPQPA
ncbi:hypothetical protein B0T17DRAFT_543807, partial [Bombardia bombarda]